MGFRRIIRQKPLKFAERAAGIIKMLLTAGGLVADGVLDKVERPPAVAFGIDVIHSALFGADNQQAFPLRVAAFGNDRPAEIFGHVKDILHQLGKILEHPVVDALKDIADGGLVLPFAVYAVGIVDMAAAKGLDITDGTVKCDTGPPPFLPGSLHPQPFRINSCCTNAWIASITFCRSS